MFFDDPYSLVFLDVETNGLHGTPFWWAISHHVRRPGARASREAAALSVRTPIAGRVDSWVAANVPESGGQVVPPGEFYQRYADAWRDIVTTWPNTLMIVETGIPVESRFLWEVCRHTGLGEPYPVLDLPSMIHVQVAAEPGVTIGSADYLAMVGATEDLPEGTAHDPLYDARLTGRAYLELTARMAPMGWKR